MSIKQGNDLFKKGFYSEAIDIYKQIDPSNPLYRWAQSNIAIAERLQDKEARPNNPQQPAIQRTKTITEFLATSLKAVKGIAEGPALTCSITNLEKNSYYRASIICETKLSATISIRDKDRNIPLYQNNAADISQLDHIFLIPPSIKSEISLSIHPNDPNVLLESLGKQILISLELIGSASEKLFKPAQAEKAIVASMATISSRLDIAIDAVYSLLGQVDRVHIHLNDSNKIPSQLRHDRIIVTTESSSGNLGDAGKFIGIHNEDDAYALICDDDFIFPYDFIIQSYLRLASEDFKAVIGMHGIFLRYPLEDYYASDARNTMHITTGFSFETTACAAGTGAVFFDTHFLPIKNKFIPDFKNMADIWFAIECNQRNIPIIIQKRRTNWIIDNPPPAQANSIWKHSESNTSSTANTRAMQTYVLTAEKNHLCTLPSRTKSQTGKDYILALDFDKFSKNIKTLENISKTKYSPSTLFIQDCKDISAARKLGRSIYCDIVFTEELISTQSIEQQASIKESDFALQATGKIELSEDNLKRLVDLFRASYADISTQLNIPIFHEPTAEYGIVRYIPRAQNRTQWATKTDARISAPVVESVLKIFDSSSNTEKSEVIRSIQKNNFKKLQTSPRRKFSEYFDQVYLLNLDRRPDRLEQFKKKASKWDINFKRISAVDGSLEKVKIEYDRIQSRLKDLYSPLGHQFKYESSSYWEYNSEGERISHLLKKNGKTYSAGGYGYLKTYKAIIEDALANRYERIAVFDDDCLFHKQLDSYFSQFIEEIPEDWVTISLGSLQYEWREKYIGWWSPAAYRCGGHSVGSHAQAYSKTAFPMLLEYIDRYTLPFDVGPLHYLKRYYSTKSFTAFPNLFIQDVGDTDIGDSAVQLAEGAKKNNVYKWKLDDYE